MVSSMKIVKGDTVYLRSGKDVTRQRRSRLQEALGRDPGPEFQEVRARMPMAEQIARANDVKGVRGRVLRVLPREGKVVVESLNMVTKHQKAGANAGAAQVQQGGRIKMEAPIPIARVMLVCPHCDKPTRVGIRTQQEVRGGRTVTVRERVCKQCSFVIARPTDTAR